MDSAFLRPEHRVPERGREPDPAPGTSDKLPERPFPAREMLESDPERRSSFVRKNDERKGNRKTGPKTSISYC